MSLVCHLYVTHMYLYATRMSLVCTRMSLVCHSYVLVCHSYVPRMYSYVTRMSLVCTCMSLKCVFTMNLLRYGFNQFNIFNYLKKAEAKIPEIHVCLNLASNKFR